MWAHLVALLVDLVATHGLANAHVAQVQAAARVASNQQPALAAGTQPIQPACRVTCGFCSVYKRRLPHMLPVVSSFISKSAARTHGLKPMNRSLKALYTLGLQQPQETA